MHRRLFPLLELSDRSVFIVVLCDMRFKST